MTAGRRWLPWLSLAPALWLWLWQAGFGLAMDFFPDDVMNMLGAYRLSWLHVLTDPLWPASGAYRPVGALFYRLLYEGWGLQPAPFHAASFMVQAVNLALVWALARRLTGRWEAGMMAALFASYHAYLSDIYASTGTIYDQLCFLFFFLALLLRHRGIWLFAACAVLAVGSKELGVLLPLAVLIEDTATKGWRRIDWRAVAAAAVIAALFLSRSFVLTGDAARFEEYTPRLQWARATDNLKNYFGMLFLRPGALSVDQACTLSALLLAGAAMIKNRAVWFGLGLFALGLGPALLVPMRSLYILYLPMGGLAIALGAASAAGLAMLPGPRPALAAMAAVLFAAGWMPLHERFRGPAATWIERDGHLISGFRQAMRQAYPSLPRGARVLFVRDRFTPDDFLAEMTMQLMYADRSLYIQRVARLGRMPEAETLRGFGYVLEDDGRQVRPAQSPGSITQSSGRPALQ
jgi:hypothetical protein